jgi:hypothetical protein
LAPVPNAGLDSTAVPVPAATRVDVVSEPAGPDADLPLEQSEDDTDRGWGERPDEVDDDERIAREKPPHY